MARHNFQWPSHGRGCPSGHFREANIAGGSWDELDSWMLEKDMEMGGRMDGWDGMGWDGMGWDGTGRDGTGRDGMDGWMDGSLDDEISAGSCYLYSYDLTD